MKKKILIVDDEPGIVKLLSMRLKAKGHQVFEAYDGMECVKIAGKEIPDLILLDIKMPQGGGIGAFEKLILSKTTREIPVIFMTAYPKPEIKNKVTKMGAMGFISKPFVSADFEQTIDMVISDDKSIGLLID